VSAFDRLDVYYDAEKRPAALNMAVDEALLETATTATIRFYGWVRPTVSFGYFGKFREAAEAGADRDLVRRWTGGGIVLHGTDLTYSIILPATDQYQARSPLDLYSDVHSAIREILIENGEKAVLANSASQKISEACFANPVRSDVLVDGRKVAGAAQRRSRVGLLQQGSIQLENLGQDFKERFVRNLCSSQQPRQIDEEITQRAHEIAQQKYSQRAWLERR
jgi:lipoate-protein ligase A